MFAAKKIVVLASALLASTAWGVTFGEVYDTQSEIDKALLSKKLDEAKARPGDSAFPAVSPGVLNAKQTVDPSNDFKPFGYYQYGTRRCADLVFRNVLLTRCVGSKEPIAGWRLTALTPQKATFRNGRASRDVLMGVTLEATTAALPPTSPAAVPASNLIPNALPTSLH